MNHPCSKPRVILAQDKPSPHFGHQTRFLYSKPYFPLKQKTSVSRKIFLPGMPIINFYPTLYVPNCLDKSSLFSLPSPAKLLASRVQKEIAGR